MREILTAVAQTLFDKKGFNILILDLKGISTMTDYLVIAEGTSDRHVAALGNAIEEALAKKGEHLFRSEGQKEGDWIVLDYGDMMIHLFQSEYREKYALEELWRKGKIVDTKIIIPTQREKHE